MNGNRKSWIKPALLAVILVSAASTGVAAAHYRDGGYYGGHGRCEHGERGHGFMSRAPRFDPGAHTEAVLAYVKAELKISADQEQAWQKFADVVRDNSKARSEAWQSRRQAWQESRDQKVAPLTERIDDRLKAMEQRTQMFKEMADAAKALYAQLTPEQQGIADHMLLPRHHRHPGHLGF